ncbi:MAG: beta strand repeat-containing protein, partial [Hyphomicrobiales bacterium]
MNQVTSQAAATPRWQEWRRFDLRSALVTTALGTGVLVGASLMPAGQALACVDVTDDPNSVSCDDLQDTTNNTLNVTAAGADSVDNDERHYLFSDHGAVDVEITANGDINDNGLAVTTSQAGSELIVDHQGAISVDDGNDPSFGGAGVFNLNTDGGDVTYTGNGSVIDNVGGNDGLVINTGVGAGNINIGSAGTPVTPTYQGFVALRTMSGTGDQNIFLDGGTLVATDTLGDGIFAASSTGDINIDLTGNTQITTSVESSNVVWGVRTNSFGGATTISSDADMGSAGFELNRGISSFSNDGLIDITQTGGTIMATGAGILAESFGATGDISITTDAGSVIDMTGTGVGIIADQFSSTGGATVTVHGNIVDSQTGVSARINDAANGDNVAVTASGDIEALTGPSISATTIGTGNATVNLLDGATMQGGVLAESTTGNAGIVLGDGVTVIGNSPGLESITAGGDATVVVGDDAMVTGSSGIVVDQTSAAGAGVATVVVGDNGEIIGDGTDGADDYNGNGIFAGNQGTGETFVTTGTGTSVTGEANGIFASQTNAANTNDITITTDGPVTGDGGIAFTLAPYTDAFDAAGLPTTGLGIGVSNEG